MVGINSQAISEVSGLISTLLTNPFIISIIIVVIIIIAIVINFGNSFRVEYRP
jgi:hypothetical protein